MKIGSHISQKYTYYSSNVCLHETITFLLNKVDSEINFIYCGAIIKAKINL